MSRLSRRKQYRKRLKKTRKRFDYYLDHLWLHYTFCSTDPDLVEAIIQQDIQKYMICSTTAVNTPSQYSQKEPDYTIKRLVIRDAIALRDLRESCDDFNPLHIRLPQRTMKDLL